MSYLPTKGKTRVSRRRVTLDELTCYCNHETTIVKGEITLNNESVPKVSHLWGKMEFL